MSIRAKKRYGQHFLQPAWADKLVAAIEPAARRPFLEIGPGPGALTLRLAPRVASLTAVELDPEMVALLQPKVPSNVTLVPGRLPRVRLRLSPARAPALRVAGNLPYNVSSPILFSLLAAHRRRGHLRRCHAHAAAGSRGADPRAARDPRLRRALDLRPAACRRTAAPVPAAWRLPSGAEGPFDRRSPALPPARRARCRTRRRSRRWSARCSCSGGRPCSMRCGRSRSRATRMSARALTSAAIDPARRPETLQLTELARLAEFFAAPFAVSCAIVCAILRSPWSAVPAAPGGHTRRGSPPRYTQAPPARAALLAGRVLRLAEQPV